MLNKCNIYKNIKIQLLPPSSLKNSILETGSHLKTPSSHVEESFNSH